MILRWLIPKCLGSDSDPKSVRCHWWKTQFLKRLLAWLWLQSIQLEVGNSIFEFWMGSCPKCEQALSFVFNQPATFFPMWHVRIMPPATSSKTSSLGSIAPWPDSWKSSRKITFCYLALLWWWVTLLVPWLLTIDDDQWSVKFWWGHKKT